MIKLAIDTPNAAMHGQSCSVQSQAGGEDQALAAAAFDQFANRGIRRMDARPGASLEAVLLDHERLARELKLAEKVQHQLLPHALPVVSGYKFFAHYQAAYEVGGDYYDFVPLAGNRLGIVLGDVSGKGIAAALVMAKFSGDTRHHVLTEGSAAAAARALNNSLCETGIEDRFITLSLSMLETDTGRLRLCSAGHPVVLLRRASGIVEELGREAGGFPLGVMPDAAYDEVEVQLCPGDVVVVYSDGVTDAASPGGELYGNESNHRLLKCLKNSSGAPNAVGEAILREVHKFSQGQALADDITLVCFGPVVL